MDSRSRGITGILLLILLAVANLHLSGVRASISCSPGYRPDWTGSICKPCPPGKAGDNGNWCMPCSPGTYSLKGMTTCIECHPGSYSGTESSACVPCAEGHYQDEFGASECIACPPGAFADEEGQQSCKQCAPGMYAESSGQSECNYCSDGEYTEEAGSVMCMSCDGFVGMDNSCLTCEQEGYELDSYMGGLCKKCDVGTYRTLMTSTCQPCAVGFHAPIQGMAECVPCPPGTYSDSTGADTCKPCDGGPTAPGGQSQSASGQSECQPCPVGHYAPQERLSHCLPCQPGSFADKEGQTECEMCGQGQHQPNWGQDKCVPCQPGTYSSLKGNKECDQAPFGSYVPYQGQNSPFLCQDGAYADEAGLTVCKECEPGSYSKAEVHGNVKCTPCPRGMITDSYEQSECTACPTGTFSEEEGQTTCKDCPMGTFSTVNLEFGTYECTDCLAGFAQPGEGAGGCIPCSAGYVAGPRSSECQPCADGTFQDGPQKDECTLCDKGDYEPDQGSTECSHAPPGSYTFDVKGQSQTQPCPLGTYQDEYASTSCKPCLEGEMQDMEGQSSCKACAPGTYTGQRGQSKCMECDYGTYQPLEGHFYCLVAQEHEYVDTTGATGVKKCELGEYAGPGGATRCEPCPPGFRGVDLGEGKVECEICPIGTHQPSAGKTECLPCKAGEYQDFEGQVDSSCRKCPRGQYQDLPGQSGCKICEKGSISFINGSKGCWNCTIWGKYQDVSGQATCKVCGAGSYDGGGDFCLPCSKGSFSNVTSTHTCSLCPVGYYQGRDETTECLPCEAGMYASTLGTVSCSPCPAGTYAPETGATTCINCPPGTWSGPGMTGCPRCPPGAYSDSPGSATCTPCAAGTIAPTSGQRSCNACPTGTHASGEGGRKCYNCPRGYVATSEATGNCSACPAGQFQPREGQSSCIVCPIGTYRLADSPDPKKCITCPNGSTTSEPRAQDISWCRCKQGEYGKPLKGPQYRCRTCGRSTQCSAGQNLPEVLKGYWIDSSKPDSVLACSPESACPGGTVTVKKTETTADNAGTKVSRGGGNGGSLVVRAAASNTTEDEGTSPCSLGYEGHACSFCTDGYFRSNTLCKRCSVDVIPSSVLLTILVAIAVMLPLLTCGVIVGVSIYWTILDQRASAGKDIMAARRPGIKGMTGSVNTNGGFFRRLLSLGAKGFRFMQIYYLLFKMNIEWPEKISRLGLAPAILALDIDVLVQPDCQFGQGGLSFHDKYLLRIVLPAVTLVLIVLTGMILKCQSFAVFCNPKLACFRFLRNLFHNCSPAALRTMFMFFQLTYVYFNTSTLDAFNCYPRGEDSYFLIADPSIQCFVRGGEWMRVLPWAVTFTIVFSLGIPALFVAVITEASLSGSLEKQYENRTVGFIFSPYKQKTFFWEVVIVTQRFFLSLVLLLAPLGTRDQINYLIFLASLIFITHVWVMPFLDSKDNIMEFNMGLAMFIASISSLVVTAGEMSSYTDTIVAVLMIGSFVWVWVFFLGATVAELARSLWRIACAPLLNLVPFIGRSFGRGRMGNTVRPEEEPNSLLTEGVPRPSVRQEEAPDMNMQSVEPGTPVFKTSPRLEIVGKISQKVSDWTEAVRARTSPSLHISGSSRQSPASTPSAKSSVKLLFRTPQSAKGGRCEYMPLPVPQPGDSPTGGLLADSDLTGDMTSDVLKDDAPPVVFNCAPPDAKICAQPTLPARILKRPPLLPWQEKATLPGRILKRPPLLPEFTHAVVTRDTCLRDQWSTSRFGRRTADPPTLPPLPRRSKGTNSLDSLVKPRVLTNPVADRSRLESSNK